MEYIKVFVTGGMICLIGQLLLDLTKLTAPRILVIFVVSGAVLQILGLYEPLVEFGKSGATVPLPGFGYALAKGAMEAVTEKGIMGALTGGLSSAAAGITAAIGFGYVVALLFSPKSIR
ncbi:MAG: stage V sporulation protein AE [Firmicutes bacterium]|nr:stage V sporulation protein AE [Bacillota bacterium]